MEKEIAEYRNLCAALRNLQERYSKRKQELRQLLGQTAVLRRDALLVLVKANRLTRHLTGRQRHITGLNYQLGEIKARINQVGPALFKGGGEEGETLPGICEWQPQKDRSPLDSRRELRQNELLILGMIDGLKKNLLQLDILELRCRELILSVNKALQAFRHEARIIRRKIYPFGVFSLLCRTLRRLWGRSYFSLHDMDDIAALGSITGHVLKIADSPII